METVQPLTLEEVWLKFNDTVVEEFAMTENTMEAECFGGSLKTNTSDPSTHSSIFHLFIHPFIYTSIYISIYSSIVHSSHPESRVRHWNAYMLFYEALNLPKISDTQKVDHSR